MAVGGGKEFVRIEAQDRRHIGRGLGEELVIGIVLGRSEGVLFHPRGLRGSKTEGLM